MNAALFENATRLHDAGRLREAAQLYSDVLRANPRHFEALYRLGAIHLSSGLLPNAERLFGAAIAINPNAAGAHYARGSVLQQLQRHEDALRCFAAALALKPDYFEARNNRGASLNALGRYPEALICFDAVLAKRPYDAIVNANRAIALLGLSRFEDALAATERALRANPSNAEGWSSRGIALAWLGRNEEALVSYGKAMQSKPGDTKLIYHRCNALLNLNRFEEAIPELENLLRLDPDFAYARGNLAYARKEICDWRTSADDRARLSADVKAGRRALLPLQSLHLFSSAGNLLQCARIWCAAERPPSPQPLWRGERYDHKRIRIAYISADFQEHAVAYALAGVFEQHDKSRFETLAFSLGPAENSPMRERLAHAFDRFIPVTESSDRAVAEELRRHDIDIAVDLMGYTAGARSGIFSHRPAPVQLNYLGYPGSMGADYMDYVIADEIVAPQTQAVDFGEALVHLPESYMPADRSRRIANAPTRAQAGLPDKGFVFCSFNAAVKLEPELFDVWMRLLRSVEKSVLWLSPRAPAPQRNLRREAGARGVSPERLIFAPFVTDAEAHLARLSLADLFLDTLPYNAHAGGVDALWAGVPLLTCTGTTFAGRVGASILSAAGMPELIAPSLAAYEMLALTLARDADALAAVKATLSENRERCALFDTAGYTRRLEAAFIEMYERQRRGEHPAHFKVLA